MNGDATITEVLYQLIAQALAVLPSEDDTHSWSINASGGTVIDQTFTSWQGRLVVFVPTVDAIVRTGAEYEKVGTPADSVGKRGGLYIPADSALGPVLITRHNALTRWVGKSNAGEVWAAAVTPRVPLLHRLVL